MKALCNGREKKRRARIQPSAEFCISSTIAPNSIVKLHQNNFHAKMQMKCSIMQFYGFCCEFLWKSNRVIFFSSFILSFTLLVYLCIFSRFPRVIDKHWIERVSHSSISLKTWIEHWFLMVIKFLRIISFIHQFQLVQILLFGESSNHIFKWLYRVFPKRKAFKQWKCMISTWTA